VEASGLPSGDDRLLVEAAKKDPSRFAELYELNFARVYAYIARRVGDRDAAQDLTSDVFHKALANIHSFEWRGVPFAGWLLRIAANMIVDRSKRGAKEITGQESPICPTWTSGRSSRKPIRARDCFSWWISCRKTNAASSECALPKREVFVKSRKHWDAPRVR
jgi:DNA-directed RNA polymerase specialized sigma24 family protein